MSETTQNNFAVVTGGSNGIGLELAKQFAEHGYDLLIVAEGDGLMAAAQDLQTHGVKVDTLAVDLADYAGVEQLYAKIKSDGRPVDAIAINAGVGVGGDFVKDTDLDEEMNMMNLNVISTVHLAKRVLKDMVARGSGHVLFTASVASIMPAPFEAVYGATKAFILSFSEALHNELRDTGVSVTALMPGPTETNFFHRGDMDDTPVGQNKKDDPADVARDGYNALMAGKDKVIAGSLKTKVQGLVAELLPPTVSAQMHRKMAEPQESSK